MAGLDDRIREVEEALDAEDFERSLDAARAAFEEHPESGWLRGLAAESLAGLGEIDEAADSYRAAVRLEPDNAALWAVLADFRFRCGDFDEARDAAQRSRELDPRAPIPLDVLAYLAEREEDTARADRLLSEAHAADSEYPVPIRIEADRFREVMAEALELLPSEFQDALEQNLAIVVEPVPPEELLRAASPWLDPTILGYYVGVPLPERETSQGPPELPDVIYLFQRNLEHVCGDREQLVREIATTLYHEIAHFFGFEEDQMEELGLE